MSAGKYKDLSGFISSLDSMGILALDGTDAVAFIHRQLSNDIENLQEDKACLAAYCSPQGRVLALFTVWKSAKRVFLAFPKDILPAIQKRLRMYVLRDDVTISDVSNEFQVYGICGRENVDWLAQGHDIPCNLYAKNDYDIGTLIKWSDSSDKERWLFFTRDKTVLNDTTLIDEYTWQKTEIIAGIPRINLVVQNRFIPQMLNLEKLGGLSFTKGCYPGQEIVARSQYRGSVKSGLFYGQATFDKTPPTDMLDGTALFNASGNECGTIVLSSIEDDKTSFLAVVRYADVSSEGVHLSKADGPIVKLIQC